MTRALFVFALVACGTRTAPAPVADPELPLVALRARDSIPAGPLRGVVRAKPAGPSTEGTHVLLDGGRREAIADETGAFTLTGVSPGVHRLALRRVGFMPTLGTIAFPAAGGAAVDGVIEQVVTCFDYCPPLPPRPHGALRDAP